MIAPENNYICSALHDHCNMQILCCTVLRGSAPGLFWPHGLCPGLAFPFRPKGTIMGFRVEPVCGVFDESITRLRFDGHEPVPTQDRTRCCAKSPGLEVACFMLHISGEITIPIEEVDIQAVRSQGAGGQNVNKVSTAVHLRFDIKASSLPDRYKERLLVLPDHRISEDGVVIIKAQRFRSQLKNREDALDRLRDLITSVMVSRRQRRATRPTRAAQERRLETKTKRARTKSLRGKVEPE